MSTGISDEKLSALYYPTYDALELEFNKRVSEYGIDSNIYLTPKAALCMLWHGIDRESLGEIRKYDILSDHIYDPIAQRAFPVSHEVVEFLNQYISTPFVVPDYISSIYVLRTKVSGKMNERTIARLLSRFNLLTNQTMETSFQITPIFESGIFNRAWTLEKNGYQFPIYRKNRKLTEEGCAEYERIFQRKFPTSSAITQVMQRYRSFVNYYYR